MEVCKEWLKEAQEGDRAWELADFFIEEGNMYRSGGLSSLPTAFEAKRWGRGMCELTRRGG